MYRLAGKLLVAAVLACAAIIPARAEVRVALVIGNGAYQNVPRLVNPVNDANDVAAALRRDGFDTILATDLDKDQMDEATIKFAKAARSADIAMFYYSGHALQFAGVNYLAPVDAKLTDEADLRRMVRVDEIVSDLQQAKNLRILVLDSCRNDPLADQLKRSIGTTRALPLQRGLAKMDTPLGMIISYSTQAGTEADDGDGRNSPYTAAFLKEIEKRDEIGIIFRRISADVYGATQHRQLPELSLSLTGEFYLRGKVDVNITPSAGDTTKDEFDAAQRIDTSGAWAAFLAKHSDGYYASLARERQKELDGGVASQQLAKAAPAEQSDSPGHNLPANSGVDLQSKYKDWKLSGGKWDIDQLKFVGVAIGTQRIITVDFLNWIKVRDMDSGKVIASWYIRQSQISSMAISPGGQQLAVILEDGTVETLDASNGQPLLVLQRGAELKPFAPVPIYSVDPAPNRLAFSIDGRRLIGFVSNSIAVWDTQTGRRLKTYKSHLSGKDWLLAVSITPENQCLELAVTMANDGLTLWDCETGNAIQTFPKIGARQAAISPDGKVVAIGFGGFQNSTTDREAAQIRELKTGAILSRFFGHSANISAMAFAFDNEVVLSADQSGAMALWEIAGGRMLRSWITLDSSMVEIKDDGSFWASADDLPKLELRKGSQTMPVPDDYRAGFLRH